MSGLPRVTVSGRLTADPELRFTPSGKAVANFSIAASERRKNKLTDEWEDGDKCFLRCAVWDQMAENVAESLRKGDEVVATGRLFQHEYLTKDDEKRTSFELKVDDLAAAVNARTQVKVTRGERTPLSSDNGWTAPPPDDPWGRPAFSDEPPF